MKVMRWIVYSPIGVLSFILGAYVFPYILGVIWKVLYFVMFWGTKYDIPPALDFEYAIEDFKSFVFTTCLGTIIAGGLAGALAGYIAPKSRYIVAAVSIYAIPVILLLLLCGYAAWNSEHWFYSTCMEITFIITGGLSIISMYEVYTNDKDD